MRATESEFRNRFWFIGLVFFAGGLCFTFDHVNTIAAVVYWAEKRSLWTEDSLTRVVLSVAALLLLAAALVRSWATAYLRSDVVHDANLHSERLVADGPYRRVRNPLYLGNLLLAIGMGALFSRVGFLMVVIGMIVVVLRLIGREEFELAKTQGESYQEYLRRVPKLLPSLRARVLASGAKPRWGDGFRGELFFWGFFVAMVALCITLRIFYFWIFLGASFAVYFLQGYLRRPKAESPK
ncbi:MAG: methyltransferase family protein [Candidatus Acidiferrales bacterium]